MAALLVALARYQHGNSASNVGSDLWAGATSEHRRRRGGGTRNPQGYARTAGRMLNALQRDGFVRHVPSWTRAGVRHHWILTPAGERVAKAAREVPA